MTKEREISEQELPEEKVKKGLPLKKLSIIIAIITSVISLFLLLGIFFTYRNYHQMKETSSSFVEWEGKAEEMWTSSEYLTENVRDFAVLGEKKYLDRYFAEAKSQTREEALEYMEKEFPGSKMASALKNALNESVGLMQTEYHAMRLKCESMGTDNNVVKAIFADYPDILQVSLSETEASATADQKAKLASTMLYDEAYLSKKQLINNSTHDCLEKLTEELYSRQNAAEGKLFFALIFEFIMIIIFIGLSIFVIVITSNQVFDPLIRTIPYIQNDSPIPVQGAYELRILANTYNAMYESHRKSRLSLKFKADHDALTGVLNRRAFDRVQEAANVGKIAFLMVDIDNFKAVNDNYGHVMGDKVLVELVALLRNHFCADDSIFRIGGDEFSIVLFGLDETNKDSISEKINDVNAILDARGKEGFPNVTISVGVAFGNLIDDALINKADTALYERKKSGKSGCSFFS